MKREILCAAALLLAACSASTSHVAADSSDGSGIPTGGGGGAPLDAPNAPSQPIAQKYYEDGPWRVTAKAAFACCDSTGNAYDVWYPTNLGAGGFQHPIITWGNGSDAVPSQYTYLLNHLATWGFIVVASETTTAHTGQEMIDAAHFIIAQSADPSSPFFGHVAANAVGAMGHSQGSGGAVRALIADPALIKTAIPIEHPMQFECAAGDCPSTTTITAGSVFWVDGTLDVLISPTIQPEPCTPTAEYSNDCFYKNTPDTLEKAWGAINGPNHNDVQGQPGCPVPPGLCTNGVYGYLGYPTVWMVAQLMHDAEARSVFQPGGEWFNDTSWSNQVSNLE